MRVHVTVNQELAVKKNMNSSGKPDPQPEPGTSTGCNDNTTELKPATANPRNGGNLEEHVVYDVNDDDDEDDTDYRAFAHALLKPELPKVGSCAYDNEGNMSWFLKLLESDGSKKILNSVMSTEAPPNISLINVDKENVSANSLDEFIRRIELLERLENQPDWNNNDGDAFMAANS